MPIEAKDLLSQFMRLPDSKKKRHKLWIFCTRHVNPWEPTKVWQRAATEYIRLSRQLKWENDGFNDDMKGVKYGK